MKQLRSVSVIALFVLLASVSDALAQYTVTIQAQSGHYVVAEDNGGSYVNANRTSPNIYETFELEDINGGALESGDLIRLRTGGGWYFGAWCNYPSNHLMANYSYGGCETEFFLDKRDGDGNFVWGQINPGDEVSFLGWNFRFWSAEYGGGDIVSHNRTAVGLWERFFLNY
jgi:chitinase